MTEEFRRLCQDENDDASSFALINEMIDVNNIDYFDERPEELKSVANQTDSVFSKDSNDRIDFVERFKPKKRKKLGAKSEFEIGKQMVMSKEYQPPLTSRRPM